MTTLHRLWLKLLLCEPEERAELLHTTPETEEELNQWTKRYARYVFTYQRHPQP